MPSTGDGLLNLDEAQKTLQTNARPIHPLNDPNLEDDQECKVSHLKK